jgi:hypothetical protein
MGVSGWDVAAEVERILKEAEDSERAAGGPKPVEKAGPLFPNVGSITPGPTPDPTGVSEDEASGRTIRKPERPAKPARTDFRGEDAAQANAEANEWLQQALSRLAARNGQQPSLLKAEAREGAVIRTGARSRAMTRRMHAALDRSAARRKGKA